MWIRMDRNRNGSLSLAELDCEELRTVLKSVIAPAAGTSVGGAAAPYARAQMNTEQAVSFILRKADLNHDGTLSFEEFESFTLMLRKLPSSVASHTSDLIFALFDLDGDHLINEAEFREIYRFYTGHRPTEVEFQAEWRRLDRAFHQAVTRDEYAEWLRASESPHFKQHAPPPGSLHKSASSPGEILPPGEERVRLSKEAEDKNRQLWKRGGLQHVGANSASLSRLGQSVVGRPKWNGSRWDPAVGTPGVPPVQPKSKSIPPDPTQMGTQVESGVKLVAPQKGRQYFMPHQTMPELMRYLRTHKGVGSKAFEEIANAIDQPGPISQAREALPCRKRPDYHLSDPIGPNHHDLPILHDRHVDGGSMRCHVTGQVKHWDNTNKVHELKEMYVAGSNSLRCPGTPPRHLYADEYYD